MISHILIISIKDRCITDNWSFKYFCDLYKTYIKYVVILCSYIFKFILSFTDIIAIESHYSANQISKYFV